MTYLEKLEAASHVLVRDEEGNIARFAMWDFHSGPECVNCKNRWCEHCEDLIDHCTGKVIYDKAYEARRQASRYEKYLELKKEYENES